MASIDPRHERKRSILRILGPLLVLVGGTLAAIGFIDFFSAFNSFGKGGFGFPGHFFFAVIGLPLFGWGLSLCRFAFLGQGARYVAAEVAPVARDTLDYLGVGVGERITCATCGHANEHGSKFCDECGKALTIDCPRCHHPNEPSSRFCQECGGALTRTAAGRS